MTHTRRHTQNKLKRKVLPNEIVENGHYIGPNMD